MYPSIIGMGGQFSLFRPYFKGVASSWVSGAVSTLAGTTWRLEGTYTGIDTYQEATLKPQFFAPNTNTYTPDWILSDYYYVNVPGPPLTTLPLNIKFVFKPGTYDIYLSIDSLNFPDWYFLDLPPSPTVWS
jgi:hypothetical protein